VEAITEVRRDNTGAACFDEGLALPTMAFPSDHAIVSAAVRLRPVAAETEPQVGDAVAVAAACDGEAEALGTAVNGDAKPVRAGSTLYDYWGIAALPPALSQITPEPIAHDGEPDAPGGDGGESRSCSSKVQPLRRRRRRGSSAGELERQVWGAGDRVVWVLFSPRPISAALSQPFFLALMFVLIVAPLFDAIACCRAVLYPPPPAVGRVFRFVPADPRHAFVLVKAGGGVHSGVQGPDTGGPVNGSGTLLVASSAKLKLGGREAAAAAQAAVADGALVLTVPPGESASAADGLACEALRYSAGTEIVMKVNANQL
jgi:hypothetical protein